MDSLLAQTAQAYAYAGGSPTNASDPSGRAAGGPCGGGSGTFLGVSGGGTLCFQISSSGQWGFTFSPAENVNPYPGFLNPLAISLNAGINVSIAANTLTDLSGQSAGGGGSVGKFVEPLGCGIDVQFSKTNDGRIIDYINPQVNVGESIAPAEVHFVTSYTFVYTNDQMGQDGQKATDFLILIPERIWKSIIPSTMPWPARP